MDAAGALLADANAVPTKTALDEELKFLLLRERKYAGLLKYRWPDDTRATFASILALRTGGEWRRWRPAIGGRR